MMYKRTASYLPYMLLLITALILFCFNLYATAVLNNIDTDITEMQTQLEKVDEPIPIAEEPNCTYIGAFTATAYCPCKICCGKWSNPEHPLTASGVTPEQFVTVGTDWATLPEGTKIYVEGLGEFTVQDKVAPWITKRYDGKVLDIYFHDHSSAVAFGKKTVDVFIIK